MRTLQQIQRQEGCGFAEAKKIKENEALSCTPESAGSVQELPLYNQMLQLTNNMIFALDQKVKFQSQEELLRIVIKLDSAPNN